MSEQANNVIACRGGDATALEPRPVPAIGAGEMLLKLRVVGFCGTDLFKLDTGAAQPGTVLGHELVGEVVALGDGVTAFQTGDRIAVPHHVPCGTCLMCRRGNETMCETFRENLMAPGGFSDTVLIKARATAQAAHKLPDDVSDEAAVFMEPAACVLRGVERAEIAADGVAVVQGAGSMGLLHLLVLKAALPNVRVVVVDPQEDRRDLAVKLGADAAAEPGEGAVDVLQVGAEVFPPAFAIIAVAAGRGIGDHHGVAFAEFCDALALGRHPARHFMTKERRHLEHAGMAAALEHLYVRAAGGRGLDAQDDLAVVGFRHGQVADLDDLGPQQHGPLHHAGHQEASPAAARDGVNRTFSALRARTRSRPA